MKDKEENKKKQIKLPDILKNKYALLVLAIGLLLVLWPSGSKTEEKQTAELAVPAFSVVEEESRLETQLSKIKGAGRVSVLLSVAGSASRELAEGEKGTLVISESGKERVVELYYVNPQYMGAVIVCEGAGSAELRLQITKAVSNFTGLGTDKISVISMDR